MVSYWFVNNEEAMFSGERSTDHPSYRVDQWPFPVVRYSDQYSDSIDDRQSSAIRFVNDVRQKAIFALSFREVPPVPPG